MFLFLACAVASPVFAADPPTALDLDLPTPSMPVPGTAPPGTRAPGTPYRGDAPGTFYGDHSGAPASVATEVSRCPLAADGSERSVTGSVTTGIGYASRGGNSHFNGANVNLCKESFNDEGEPRSFNLNIDVQQYDGPGLDRGYGGRYSGWRGR